MKRFGLIGKTLKHSFSKTYFAKKFSEEGILECTYENFELSSIEEFPNLIASNPDLKGLNVTIPYKEEVLQFLNLKNEIVQGIGACNCIKFVDGALHGYNTDVIAFRDSLQKQLQTDFTGRSLIVMAAGIPQLLHR